MVKASAYNEGDLGLIPGSGRSPGGGYGNPLQYSFLENPHGPRGPWWATVCGGHKELDMTERLSPAQHINQCDITTVMCKGEVTVRVGGLPCRAGDLGSFCWDREVAEGTKDEKERNIKAEEHCRQRARESQGKLGCLDKGDEVVSSSWGFEHATQKTFKGFDQR